MEFYDRAGPNEVGDAPTNITLYMLTTTPQQRGVRCSKYWYKWMGFHRRTPLYGVLVDDGSGMLPGTFRESPLHAVVEEREVPPLGFHNRTLTRGKSRVEGIRVLGF